MMVMTLCLMVYAIAQFELRTALETAEDTIPTQTKKETSKPSMKWVYRLFHGVQVITLILQGVTQEIVINLKALQKKSYVTLDQKQWRSMESPRKDWEKSSKIIGSCRSII